ncbi:MAG: NADH-quinone oxidoreductase subunit D [Armatimonadota bacterium]|nr:MAG: NADH-quinone oxidoreductase subunit D [Armatimonadota bacterium]
MIINMGPQHPSTHGVLRLILTLEGEVITDVDPDIGYLHRGMEKIAENRTYAQYLPYTDRIDYLASLNCNLAYCVAVERLAGIEVPERAQYIRVILAELNRVASHLIFLATFGNDLGATTVFLYGMRERELIIDLFEMAVGARLTYSGMRIGGMPYDLPDGFEDAARAAIGQIRPRLDENDRLLTGNRIFESRTQGVGVLSRENAIAYAVSGPTLRGSGVAMDVRRDDPYCVYDRLEFDVPSLPDGDCFARYLVRIEEMRQSLRIVEQCLDQMPAGPVRAKLPRVFKPPAGEAYGRTEAPRGDLSVFVVSDGSANPCRLRVRAPSFANLQALKVMARGHKIGDIVAILGSLDIVLGEIDR